jgi:GNAT superfamily N-acetyltransferase
MDLTISTDPARLDVDRVHGWLAAEYWCPGVRKDVVARAFAASLCAGAYDERGVQRGVARAVTDQATFAWLCDVFVEPAARGRGVARALVQALLSDPRTSTVRTWCLATRDAHGVYAPLGFAPAEPGRWMVLRPDPARWQAREWAAAAAR